MLLRITYSYKLCTLMHGVAFGYASSYLLHAAVHNHSRHYQEERISGRQTMDSMT